MMLRKKRCLVIFDFEPKGGLVWFTVVIELQTLRLVFNIFTAFKGNNFLYFVFAITVAGVVSRGGLKKSPRASSVVQIIFYFWFLRLKVTSMLERSEFKSKFLWGAVLLFIPYLWISKIHFWISIIHFWISTI